MSKWYVKINKVSEEKPMEFETEAGALAYFSQEISCDVHSKAHWCELYDECVWEDKEMSLSEAKNRLNNYMKERTEECELECLYIKEAGILQAINFITLDYLFNQFPTAYDALTKNKHWFDDIYKESH